MIHLICIRFVVHVHSISPRIDVNAIISNAIISENHILIISAFTGFQKRKYTLILSDSLGH